MLIEYKINNVQDLRNLADILATTSDWWYRGVCSNEYLLKPSLERLTENRTNFNHLNSFKHDSMHPPKLIEIYSINQFKKNSKKLLSEYPDENNHAEWVAIMQHYGAATRFLDITTQFYTALFFALDEYCLNGNSKNNPAIYCFNRKKLLTPEKENSSNYILRDLHQYIDGGEQKLSAELNKLLIKPIEDPDVIGVVPYQPYFKNERMHVQDGLFLVPLNISYPFEFNLLYQYRKSNSYKINDLIESTEFNIAKIKLNIQKEEVSLIKIVIDEKIKKDIHNLLFTMNKDHKSLYPDIQGIALYCKTPAIFENKNLLKELHIIEDQEEQYSLAMKKFHLMLGYKRQEKTSDNFNNLVDEIRNLFKQLIATYENDNDKMMKLFNCYDCLVTANLFLLIREENNYNKELLDEIDAYSIKIKDYKPIDNMLSSLIANRWYELSEIFKDKKTKKHCLEKAFSYINKKQANDNYLIILILFELILLEEDRNLQKEQLQSLLNLEKDEMDVINLKSFSEIRLRLAELSKENEDKKTHLAKAEMLIKKYTENNFRDSEDFNETLVLYSKFISRKLMKKFDYKVFDAYKENYFNSSDYLFNMAGTYLNFSKISEKNEDKIFYTNKAKNEFETSTQIKECLNKINKKIDYLLEEENRNTSTQNLNFTHIT